MGRHTRAEDFGQRLCAGLGAIDDLDRLETARQQGMDDGPACAAGAEHHGRPACIPTGSLVIEIGGKSVGIGVGGHHLIILPPQRIGGPDLVCDLVDMVHQVQHGLLVRNRDIAAGKA